MLISIGTGLELAETSKDGLFCAHWFFLTRSKLRKPLREVLTRPYAGEGFAYQTRADKAVTKIVKEGFQNFEFRQTEV